MFGSAILSFATAIYGYIRFDYVKIYESRKF